MRYIRLIIIIGTGLLGLLYMSNCSSTAFKNHEDNGDFDYIGYFLMTNENCFFVADGNSSMFSDKEFIKIYPVDETVTFDRLNSGDKVGIDIITVGDLNPRVMDIYRIGLLETGDISNIDESVIADLYELGFQVIK